jgi:hypothetical protein
MLNGQVERRARASIQRVGSIWYSAWIDAGQPDLKKLMEKEPQPEEEKYDKKLKIEDREAGDLSMAPANTWELIYGECSGHGSHGHRIAPNPGPFAQGPPARGLWPIRLADLGL